MKVGTSLAALAFVVALVPAAGRAQLPPTEPTPPVTPPGTPPATPPTTPPATPPTPPATPPITTTPTTTLTPSTAVTQIVEMTQVVAPGASVTAFTPPAGATLVVTDVLLTNTNTTAVCGVDVARGGTAVTGGLCVPPTTSVQLTLVTGIEFADTPVQLVSPAEAGGPVTVHMRGFVM